ncbi:hypothetical protein EVAR_91377_1 [Eumeta japonica]|uniref:Uncharacterized protein n=1 Tax=Eumeta variegata TaxID=151549 RepID=A0A4C1XBI4_EUMVA|nr:hypothetical protein EVAR_91377_1 [Eumeta japonica]
MKRSRQRHGAAAAGGRLEKVESRGLPGRACLLRAVCESARAHLHHNGLVGDLLHIVFTPSSSEAEDLDDEFYEAEYSGLIQVCHHYVDACPDNPLAYFSVLL